MKFGYLLLLPILASTTAQAVDADRLMRDRAWEKRVLLIFAPNQRHAVYRQQVAEIEAVGAGLRERDMTVIETLADGSVAIDGQARESPAASFYRRFAVDTDEFRAILVGKDGTVKLDRDDPVTSEDLFDLIDSMPMRRRELRRND